MSHNRNASTGITCTKAVGSEVRTTTGVGGTSEWSLPFFSLPQDTLEKCAKCQAVILKHIVRALGNGYHPACFTCVVCGRGIGDESFAVDDQDQVHCVDDFYRYPVFPVERLPPLPASPLSGLGSPQDAKRGVVHPWETRV